MAQDESPLAELELGESLPLASVRVRDLAVLVIPASAPSHVRICCGISRGGADCKNPNHDGFAMAASIPYRNRDTAKTLLRSISIIIRARFDDT